MLRRFTLFLLLAPAIAHAQDGTITVGALQRTYTVRLPSAYDGNTPLPLVIAMHGGFGSGTQLENQSQLTVKAEQEGIIVVYPDGMPSLLGIRTWNAGGCCGYAMNNNIDTLRIYATGMSNGGFMSYRLACELSDRIAAIAPVSASMTIDACQPLRPVPVISIHSYLDTSVPYLGGVGDGVSGHYNSPQDSVLNAFAAHANCTVLNDTMQHDASMTVIRWHDCDCGTDVITYRTQDGGHSWHGGNGTGIGDPPSTTISANDLMWGFFQEHTLDCLPMSTSAPPMDKPVLVLSPNPAQGFITISGCAIQHFAVMDVSGREVLHPTPANATSFSVDVGRFSPGAYTVRATAPDGHVHVMRFVRE
jgi:polyhydroxybutyrate depolymerase